MRSRGVALAAASAFCYGLTVVLGRALARSGLHVASVLGIRFAIATLFLGALVAGSRRRVGEGSRRIVVAFLAGAIGYAAQATLFFSGLQRGTAAAVTLLFYAFPAFVVVLEMPLVRRMPPRPTLLALGLASAGVAVIVASSGDVAVTRVGAVLALSAGLAFAMYVLAGDRLLGTLDARVSALGVCAGTAASFLLYGAATGTLRAPGGWLPQLAGNGLATGAAFAFLFAALARIGPSDTSVVMTLEAFFATVLAAVTLGEAPEVVQLFGGAGIVAGAVVITVSSRLPASRAPAGD